MSTFAQLLRIGFWMLPLQRWLTMLGLAIVVAGQLLPLPIRSPGSTLPVTFLGVGLVFLVPLLAGGVFLRMLSTSRALLLRPHARGRLLAGTVGILLLAASAWLLTYWLAFRPVPLQYRPGADDYALMYVMALSLGTQCAISLFIASRSPHWTLVILLAWQVPGLVLHGLGVVDAALWLGRGVTLAVTAMSWLAFAVWYLRTRRIHASGWGRKSHGAAQDFAMPASRDEAMVRWLLGGTTPSQLGLYCLLAALAVLAIQWIFARGSEPGALRAMMFGALSATAIVAGSVARAMTQRSRSLWLPAGRTRLQLHAWTERQLLRVLLAISIAVALACVPAWFLASPPAMPVGRLLAAVLLPGMAAAWLGLMQQRRPGLFDALAGVAIAAGWFYGLVQPLYVGATELRWEILVAQLGLVLLLREAALVRWRSADWRRAQRA